MRKLTFVPRQAAALRSPTEQDAGLCGALAMLWLYRHVGHARARADADAVKRDLGILKRVRQAIGKERAGHPENRAFLAAIDRQLQEQLEKVQQHTGGSKGGRPSKRVFNALLSPDEDANVVIRQDDGSPGAVIDRAAKRLGHGGIRRLAKHLVDLWRRESVPRMADVELQTVTALLSSGAAEETSGDDLVQLAAGVQHLSRAVAASSVEDTFQLVAGVLYGEWRPDAEVVTRLAQRMSQERYEYLERRGCRDTGRPRVKRP